VLSGKNGAGRLSHASIGTRRVYPFRSTACLVSLSSSTSDAWCGIAMSTRASSGDTTSADGSPGICHVRSTCPDAASYRRSWSLPTARTIASSCVPPRRNATSPHVQYGAVSETRGSSVVASPNHNIKSPITTTVFPSGAKRMSNDGSMSNLS
jgi:hypothetical protein